MNALGARLNKCRLEVGDVGLGRFRKLMSAVVDSTMLYGAEIYMGLNKEPRSTRTSTDVHLPNVLGVGTLHPKASLFI